MKPVVKLAKHGKVNHQKGGKWGMSYFM
jgi:hypothetical protein